LAPSMMLSFYWPGAWWEHGQLQVVAGCQEQLWPVTSRVLESLVSAGLWEELRSPLLCCWTRMRRETGCLPHMCWTLHWALCAPLVPLCISLAVARHPDRIPPAGLIQISFAMEVRASTAAPPGIRKGTFLSLTDPPPTPDLLRTPFLRSSRAVWGPL
jgi:hypothetical protein